MTAPHSATADFPIEATPEDPRLETLRALACFLRDHVLKPSRAGKLPPPRAIVIRLVVLQALLFPDSVPSLAGVAIRLNSSRAWLSRVGLTYADRLGLRASWQRIAHREQDAQRARSVHRGTWERPLFRDRSAIGKGFESVLTKRKRILRRKRIRKTTHGEIPLRRVLPRLALTEGH